MDILNPTPAFGWCRRQFPPADERLRAELVLALALIHHLIFTNWQNFERVIESIKSFQKKWAIYEFIEMEDKMVQKIRRDSKVSYSWYTLENFLVILNNHYSKVELLPKISSTRNLLLCTL